MSLITEVDIAPKLPISVDYDVCVGNAMCQTFAPKVFVLNENRQSEVADPEADTAANILEAEKHCTVSAITVVEEEAGETLFP